MSALAANRNTPKMDGFPIPTYLALPVAAATKIYAGSLVAINAAGNAVPGSTSATLKAAGRARKLVDNTGAAGAKFVEVDLGAFKFANESGDAVVAADRFALCYIVDDQTVAKTDDTGARSIAGVVIDVDAAGVWVLLNPFLVAV